MSSTAVTVENATTHNLKGVSVSLPRNQLVVVTGVSGSGKSSLVFDTIYAEGQRRYVESLSTYARQFVGTATKPPADRIDGLSPAISIDQKTLPRGLRSTVGTVTEVYDYLRVLFARVGTPHCPACDTELSAQTSDQIEHLIRQYEKGARLQCLAPVVRGRKGDYNALFAQLRKQGFARARIDGELVLLDELEDDYRLTKSKTHTIEVVMDRIIWDAEDEAVTNRMRDALGRAFEKADGFASIEQLDSEGKVESVRRFAKQLACPTCDRSFEELAPRLFSFNSPYGACPQCDGTGIGFVLDEALLVPDRNLSVADGAILPLNKLMGRYTQRFLRQLAKRYRIDIHRAFDELPETQRRLLLYGERQPGEVRPRQNVLNDDDEIDWFGLIENFEGVVSLLQIQLQNGTDTAKRYVKRFLRPETCPVCEGTRLKPESLSVRLGGKHIAEVCALSLERLRDFLQALPTSLTDTQLIIGRQAIADTVQRVGYLLDLGLGYLTLARRAETLSGGEAQRLRLASQLGVGLSGILYILDEPSIGLHPANTRRLLETLKRLRDAGNSLIVVEHDEDTMRAADWLVEIGPRAGVHGGEVVCAGALEDFLGFGADTPENGRNGKKKTDNDGCTSITAAYLSGRREIATPLTFRQGTGTAITLTDVAVHNLRHIKAEFPLGKLIAVTGPSGSGKSSLVFHALKGMAEAHFDPDRPPNLDVGAITGLEHIDKLIEIDQSPIGRTRRSNPATYTGLMDIIRTVFANTEEARIHGWGPGRFSFNTAGGRCELCKGEGAIITPMQFMPDVVTPCDICHGARYNAETLAMTYNGKNIAQVLGMSVAEAVDFFSGQPRLHAMLGILSETGLDYLTLGQPATTLSGGEAQRLKLATEFLRKATGATLYLLDEPTVGLHWADLEKLLGILNRLVDQSNTVVVIEHHPDFIKACDWVLDLGPGSGEAGGEIVAAGTPAELAHHKEAPTGPYLARYFETATN